MRSNHRSWTVIAGIALLLWSTTLSGSVAAATLGGSAAPSAGAAESGVPGVRLRSTTGHSSSRRILDPQATAAALPERSGPARSLTPTSSSAAAPKSPREPASPNTTGAAGPAGSTVTIPSTTTLSVPAGPVTFPAMVHLEADVSPAPVFGPGVIPAIMFTVDGGQCCPAEIDALGHAELDQELPVGSYEIVAVFFGFGDLEPSSSSPATVEVVQLPGLATALPNTVVQSGHGFAGLAATADQYSPAPSPGLAVGPDNIIQVTSVGFRFSDRSGQPMFDVPLAAFFIEDDNYGTHGSDPRVLFDDMHDRWIATQTVWGQHGHLHVAISSTADPLDFWWVYDFVLDANLGPANSAIGLSSNKIGIGLDEYSMSPEAFHGSRLLIIDAASIVDGDDVITYQASATDAGQFSWRPAVGQSAGAALHAVGSGPTGGVGDHLLHMTVTGTVTNGNLAFSVEDLTSGSAGLPGVGEAVYVSFGSGSGDTMQVLVPRGPAAAVWQGGSLWFVSTRSCMPEGASSLVACVRVTELSTGATTGVVQDFVVNPESHSTYAGGIGLTGAGDLVLSYTSSSGVSVTLFAAVQAAADPANSLHEPALIEAGTGFSAMNSLSPTTIVRDPLDPSALWQGGAVNKSGGWRTWISRLSVATSGPNGALVLNDGRAHANALRIGVGGTLAPANSATRMRLSNSSATVGSDLAQSKEFAVADRIPWSLADPSTGGSTSTGNRSVYVQWGNGAGGWSSVESATVSINTPLGSSFVALTPARLLDTRVGNGLTGRFTSGTPRSFQVTGRGNVPANAVAVTGNLTVTGQTRAGYVFLGPTASATPTSSTLNFPLGDTRANGVTVKLSGTGKLGAVYKGPSGSSTNLIFDVTGYFVVSDPNAPVGSTWVPIEPLRVLDTRFGNGLSGRFANSVPRTFFVTGFGIPANATAVTGNVTVTGQTSAGYLFVGPSTGPNPTSSTINVPLSDNRANNATLRLGAGGTLSAVWKGAPGSLSHLIFDVTGYFVEGPWGATYIPLTPVRLLDTRVGTGLTGKFVDSLPRSLGLAGTGGIPAADTLGITANVTVVSQSSAGYVFVGPSAVPNPTSSTLNFPKADTRANGLDVALNLGDQISAVFKGSPGATTHLLMDVTGYFR